MFFSAARTIPRIFPIQNRIQKLFLSTETKEKIESLIKSHKVLVFMKGDQQVPQCGFSRAVVQILQLQGVKEFTTVNVLEDLEIRSGIKEFNNWPTIPQVFIKGEFIGGTDILLNMHQSGELEDLLIKEGIVKDE